MLKNSLVASVTFACLAAGCANGEDTELSTKSVPQPAAVVKPESDKAAEVPIGAGLQRLVDLAKTDLHTRSGVATEQMEVIKADFVTWRDRSVGCPSAGHQYPQVLTPGSRIHLRVEGKVYLYHSGGNRAPFLCETPSREEPLPYAHGES
jgi:hypothetical protein